MKNKSTILRFACLSAVAAAFVLVSGQFSQANAQRDPFAKANYMKVKEPAKTGTGTGTGKSHLAIAVAHKKATELPRSCSGRP